MARNKIKQIEGGKEEGKKSDLIPQAIASPANSDISSLKLKTQLHCAKIRQEVSLRAV